MLFSGTMTLDAEAGKVWDFLLDAKAFAACVPGVEKVVQIDERTFEGVIQATVGPISGEFPFRAEIKDSKPPTELSALVHGTDSITRSTIDAELSLVLTALPADQTELGYKAVVNIKGRLAIIGDMVLRATAAVMLEEFKDRVRRNLESDLVTF